VRAIVERILRIAKIIGVKRTLEIVGLEVVTKEVARILQTRRISTNSKNIKSRENSTIRKKSSE
jgi:hypothetical protein